MIRKAVGAIIIYRDQIMLVKKRTNLDIEKSTDGVWDFPKGGVENEDDDLYGALIRELKEETGSTKYKILKKIDRKINFKFSSGFKLKTGYSEQETTMFLVEYMGSKKDVLGDGDEIIDVQFFEKQSLIDILCYNETIEFYNYVLKEYL